MENIQFAEYNSENLSSMNLEDFYTSTFIESERRMTRTSRFVEVCKDMFIGVLLTASMDMQASPRISQDVSSSMSQIEYDTKEKNTNFVQMDFENFSTQVVVNRTYAFSKIYLKNLKKDAARVQKIDRELALRRNFSKNKPLEFQSQLMGIFGEVTKILSDIPFKDNIVQYNLYENTFEFSLFLVHDIELAIGVYSDDESDMVDFSIYQDGELLVTDSMDKKGLVRKVHNILGKLEYNV